MKKRPSLREIHLDNNCYLWKGLKKNGQKWKKVDNKTTYSKCWSVVPTIQWMTGMSLVSGPTWPMALKRIYISNYKRLIQKFFTSTHSCSVQVITLNQGNFLLSKTARDTRCHSQFGILYFEMKIVPYFLISCWTWMRGNLLCKLPTRTPISTHSYPQSPWSTLSLL